MQTPSSLETPVEAGEAPPQLVFHPPTPITWRLGILAAITAIAGAAYAARENIGLQGQALAGIVFFFGIVAAFSSNLMYERVKMVRYLFFTMLQLIEQQMEMESLKTSLYLK